MFGFGGLFSIGGILVIAALVHFIRKRPDFFWLWVILFLGPLGALVYLAVEALPELTDPGAFKFVSRGSRKRELEAAVVENPSAGNYEELGQIYLDEQNGPRLKTPTTTPSPPAPIPLTRSTAVPLLKSD